jgi:hypothetical protein
MLLTLFIRLFDVSPVRFFAGYGWTNLHFDFDGGGAAFAAEMTAFTG